MNYAGIDYHKKYSYGTVINQEGEVIKSRCLSNDHGAFQEFFRSLNSPCKAVLEASRTWGVMFDLLDELSGVDSVVLAHPYKVRAIAEAKIKTDKIDSNTLAQLLRADLIPAAYIPDKKTRVCKEMLCQRIFLVRMRTRVKNRIHLLLDRLHIPLPSLTDIFGKRGVEYLKKLSLPGVDGESLREDILLLEVFNSLVKDAEKEIEGLLGDDLKVKLLRTVPGFGAILAAVVAIEIDDVERFNTPPKLASYAGLVPSTYASGGKIFHGRLLPQRNKWLRWAFVEAAWASLRYSPYCRTFFENRKEQKGSNTAIISLARRLSEITWHILKEKRAYEERPYQLKKRIYKNTSPAALN